MFRISSNCVSVTILTHGKLDPIPWQKYPLLSTTVGLTTTQTTLHRILWASLHSQHNHCTTVHHRTLAVAQLFDMGMGKNWGFVNSLLVFSLDCNRVTKTGLCSNHLLLGLSNYFFNNNFFLLKWSLLSFGFDHSFIGAWIFYQL